MRISSGTSDGAAMPLDLPMPDAPHVGSARFPDHYLEFHADAYVRGGWCFRGVTLMQYLATPDRYEHSGQYPEPLPLLARQRRVQARVLEAEQRALRAQGPSPGELLDLAWGERA